MENKIMSDNNTPNNSAPSNNEAPSSSVKSLKDAPMSISGAEAKALFEAEQASKVAGKTLVKKDAPKEAPKEVSSESLVKEAVKEAKRKLKIGDEEIDEDEVIETYKRRKEHQREASKILTQGQQAKKQAEMFVNMMKDPEKFFEAAKKLGHDPLKLTEGYLGKFLEDQQLDPRDKELRDTKKKLQAIEDMERQKIEAVQKERNEQLKAKFAKDYSDQFVSALKDTGLPPTKPMVAEMAKYIGRSAKLGFQMTAAEAAQLVREDVQMAHQRLIGDTDGETLIKLLGEEVANKVRKWDTSRVKSPESQLRTPVEQGEKSERAARSANKRMSAAEWREFNRKK